MPAIIWLASYPKSGNTWLRLFLKAYRDAATLQSIEEMETPIAASRTLLDEALGLESADLLTKELRDLLPLAYRAWAALPHEHSFLKTHDAYSCTRAGEPIFPIEASRCVLHLLRDPRDVAISLAHHNGCTLDEAITQMNDPEYWAANNKVKGQIPQFFSDWSTHTRSWLASPLPRLTLRYEDMLAEPVVSFARIVEFCGLEPDPQRLNQALEATRFERLQKREAEAGFSERPAKASAPFFRSGRSGGWKEKLTPAQSVSIVKAHGTMMRQFGYE